MPALAPALVWDREYHPDWPRATRCLLGAQGGRALGGHHVDRGLGLAGSIRFWWIPGARGTG